MKKSLRFMLIIVAMIAITARTYSQDEGYQDAQADNSYQQSISYQDFYDGLSPYGQWINYPSYGYVWSPSVEYGFKPYASNGHWVYSDMGWTWVSGYSWGWATFHYGRWFFDNSYGWLWMPGYDWAPAWVSWRSSNDYYGWAPLSPGFGFSEMVYNPPTDYWCFVPNQYVCSPYVYNYYVQSNRNITIINNTTVINTRISYNRGYGDNNFRQNGASYFAAGPNPREVERFTHNAVRPVVIRNDNRPGMARVNNNELRIFRPSVNAAAGNSRQGFSPARTETFRGTVNNNNNARLGVVYGNNFNRNENRFEGNAGNNRQVPPVASYNNNTNRTSDNRPGNGQLYPNRRNEPVADNRQYNNNPAFRPANRPVSNQPAISQPFRRDQAPRQIVNNQAPVFRGNEYRQAQPSMQRIGAPQQTNPGRPSMQQGAPIRQSVHRNF